MAGLVPKPAPEFATDAVIGEAFQTIRLSDYRGRYVVLFFYPLYFTFVCPTEIIPFSDRIDEFLKRDAAVIGVSVDSKLSHLAWAQTPRKAGGLGWVHFSIVSDPNFEAHGEVCPADWGPGEETMKPDPSAPASISRKQRDKGRFQDGSPTRQQGPLLPCWRVGLPWPLEAVALRIETSR